MLALPLGNTGGARQRQGFSLVELLVVIGVVTLLLSLLLPALSTAREISKRTVCLANLRGLAQSAVIYAKNWEEVFPVEARNDWVGAGGATTGPLPWGNMNTGSGSNSGVVPFFIPRVSYVAMSFPDPYPVTGYACPNAQEAYQGCLPAFGSRGFVGSDSTGYIGQAVNPSKAWMCPSNPNFFLVSRYSSARTDEVGSSYLYLGQGYALPCTAAETDYTYEINAGMRPHRTTDTFETNNITTSGLNYATSAGNGAVLHPVNTQSLPLFADIVGYFPTGSLGRSANWVVNHGFLTQPSALQLKIEGANQAFTDGHGEWVTTSSGAYPGVLDTSGQNPASGGGASIWWYQSSPGTRVNIWYYR